MSQRQDEADRRRVVASMAATPFATMARPAPGRTAEATQQRFAARVAAALTEHAAALPHHTSERLRVARERALDRASGLARPKPAPRSVPALATAAASGGAGEGGWGWRLASLLPLVALVAGLVLVERFTVAEQVHAAAEIDAALLADDLPPEAYADPGFVEFLRQPPRVE
jgi:hypothetical protein